MIDIPGYDVWKLAYPPEWDKENNLGQCGEVIIGYHACQGVPGWEDGEDNDDD